MTELAASSIAKTRLGRASRLIAATTAERPTSSGIAAATSAPKTTMRIPSVTGTAVYSARLKSAAIVCSSASCALASPNASTRKPAWRSCTAASEWRLDVRDAVAARDGADDVGKHGSERRIVRHVRLARDEDRLVRGVGEAAGREDLLRLLRLADRGVSGIELLGAERRAEDGGNGDEGEPAEDRSPAVAGAPAAHAGREAGAVLERRHRIPPDRRNGHAAKGRPPGA